MNNLIDKWDEILQIMKKEYSISEVAFTTWLKPLTVYGLEDHTVTIAVPPELDVLGLNYISSHYKSPLKVTIAIVLGMDHCDVKFVFADQLPKKQAPVISNVQQDSRFEEAHLNPRYTFDTFIV